MDYIPTRISCRAPIPTPAQRSPISIRIDSTVKDNVTTKRSYDTAFLQSELENYLRAKKKGTTNQNTRKAIVIPVCNKFGKCEQRRKSNTMPIPSEVNGENPCSKVEPSSWRKAFEKPAKQIKETNSKKSYPIISNVVVEIYQDVQLSDSVELKKNAALQSDKNKHRSVVKQDELGCKLKNSKDITTNGAVKTKQFYDAAFLNDEMDNYLRSQMTNAKISKFGTKNNGGKQTVDDKDAEPLKACKVFKQPAKGIPSEKLDKHCNKTTSKPAIQNSTTVESFEKCSTLPTYSVLHQDLELSDSEDELQTLPKKDTLTFEVARKNHGRHQTELKKAELKNSKNISTNEAVKIKRFCDATFLNDEMDNYLRIKMTKAKKLKKDVKKKALKLAVPEKGKPRKTVFTPKKVVSSLVGKVTRSEIKGGHISDAEPLTTHKTLQVPSKDLFKEKFVKHCNETSLKPAIRNSNPAIAEKCSTLSAYSVLHQDYIRELNTSPKKDTLKTDECGLKQAELKNAIMNSKDTSTDQAVKTKQIHEATFLSDEMDNYLLGKMTNGKKPKNGINKKCESKAVLDEGKPNNFKVISDADSFSGSMVLQDPAKKLPNEKLAKHCNGTSSKPAEKCSTLLAYSVLHQDLELSDFEDELKTSPKMDTVGFDAPRKYDRRNQNELKRVELKSGVKNSKDVSVNEASKTNRLNDATFLNDEMDNYLRVKMTNSKNGIKQGSNRQTVADDRKRNIFKDISSTSQKKPVLKTSNRSELSSFISSAELKTLSPKDTTKLNDVRKQERKLDIVSDNVKQVELERKLKNISINEAVKTKRSYDEAFLRNEMDNDLRITITLKNGIYKIRKGDSGKPISNVKNTAKKPLSSSVAQQKASAKSNDQSNNYWFLSTKSNEPKMDTISSLVKTAEVNSSQRKMSSETRRSGLSAPKVLPQKHISKSLRLKKRFIELFGETSDDESEAV